MDVLLSLLEVNGGKSGLRHDYVRQHLSRFFGDSAVADAVIQRAIEALRVEPVLDFDKDDPSPTTHVWHLKLLTEEQRSKMRATCRACKTLLQLLWNTRDPENLGLLPVEEAHRSLRAAGFRKEKIESVGGEITDRVETVARESDPVTGKLVLWYRLIPEYERHPSPECLEALRKADREFMEKEALVERLLEESQEGGRRAKKPLKERGSRT